MNRRRFVRNSFTGVAGVALASVSARAKSPAREGNPPAAFELDEATIADLQSGMRSGKHTAQSLARKYLERIDDVDKRGPAVNSVIELNPDAPAIAENLDRILADHSQLDWTPPISGAIQVR